MALFLTAPIPRRLLFDDFSLTAHHALSIWAISFSNWLYVTMKVCWVNPLEPTSPSLDAQGCHLSHQGTSQFHPVSSSLSAQGRFPGGSEGKVSACNTGDLGPVPGSGRSPEKEMANLLLPGKFHGQRSLVGYSPQGCEELNTTEWLHFLFLFSSYLRDDLGQSQRTLRTPVSSILLQAIGSPPLR